MIASVHVADVGPGRALGVLRKAPAPGSSPGLRSARVGLAAPLSGSVLPAPSIGRVAVVAMWDDDDALDRFLAESPAAAPFADGWHVRLEPVRAFGTWPGLDADLTRARAADSDGPVAVLTLGRLRLSRAVPFLRTSARAEGAAVAAPGLVWATGLARPPFVATCSLWRDAEASVAYAYGSPDAPHPHAITTDRVKPFHHESAFVRFRPYASEGSLAGRNPLPASWLAPA